MMENIEDNERIKTEIVEKYHTFSLIRDFKARIILTRLLYGSFLFFLVVMFLPWTQNVQTRGNVTALNPSHRPQNIQSVIGGRIERWYVNEGDFVNKGDTILYLSELKSEYMDPGIVPRAAKQIEAKELSVDCYSNKVRALDQQINALYQTQKLKIEQSENYIKQGRLKIQSDISYQDNNTVFQDIGEQVILRLQLELSF